MGQMFMVKQCIADRLRGLANTSIDAALVKTTKEKILADLGLISNLHMMPEKRTVEITYRGVAVPLLVHSVHEQIDFSLAAIIKTAAIMVKQKPLPCLFCEYDLMPVVPSDHTVADDLYADMRMARCTANEMIHADWEGSADSILRLLKEKEPFLTQIDHSFKIEVAFFKIM